MSKALGTLYFCSHCHSNIEKIDDILRVDRTSMRIFCTGSCIEDYFDPYVDYFLKIEEKERVNLGLEAEKLPPLDQTVHLREECLERPDEVYKLANEFGEILYVYFKEFTVRGHGKYTQICICSRLESEPSFVFFETMTKSQDLIDQYKCGDKVEVSAKDEELPTKGSFDVPPDVMELVESKKSSYLAELLSIRKESDISYEEFHLYDDYTAEALQDPDEVYRYEEDGDPILVYIKSFEESDISFFYFVICYHYYSDEDKGEEVVLPILTFPSIDGDLYHHFKKGDQVAGTIKS